MSSLFDLTGKVAIVTGSTKGIGLAIASRMAEHGATVVGSSRKPDACEAVAKTIRDAGGKAIVIPCHVARKEELQNLVDKTVEQCGGLDIVVSNAAVNPYLGPQAGASDDVFERVMGTNVRSNFWLSNMACPHLAARGGGSFIIISSIGGLIGSASLGLYGISKAADIAVIRHLAVSCAPISRGRYGKIRCATRRPPATRRLAASASRMKSRVRRFISLQTPAASCRARRS